MQIVATEIYFDVVSVRINCNIFYLDASSKNTIPSPISFIIYDYNSVLQNQNMNIKITHPRLFMFFILLWPCNYKLNFTYLTTQNTTHLVSIMSYSKSLDGQKYLIILIDLISNIYTMFF